MVLFILRVVHIGSVAVGVSRYLLREDIHRILVVLRGHGVVRSLYSVRLCDDNLSYAVSIIKLDDERAHEHGPLRALPG